MRVTDEQSGSFFAYVELGITVSLKSTLLIQQYELCGRDTKIVVHIPGNAGGTF